MWIGELAMNVWMRIDAAGRNASPARRTSFSFARASPQTVLVVIAFALRREGQVVRQYLVVDLNSGFLTREEYDQVGSIFGRIGSSFRALSQNGYQGWRARKRFNQLASELAFHRCRVSRGVFSGEQEARAEEAAYLQALQDLVNELRRR